MNPHTSQNWATLPGHLLQKVFAECDLIDRISAERVCSHWKVAMSYADMTMIDLKDIFAEIKKQDLAVSDWRQSCVIQPSALTLCLDFLNMRKRITRLTCSPPDNACENYCCLNTKLPYTPGDHPNDLLAAQEDEDEDLAHRLHASHILDELTYWDIKYHSKKYWMLDMTVLDFLARECGDTLEALDLTHCAVDGPTLAMLHSQGFPKLVEYSTSGVNKNADDITLSLNISNFPALKSLNLTRTAKRYSTALPTQLTTLRLMDVDLHCGRSNSLCLLEQCPNLEELYLINFYFLEQQFENKEFRFKQLKTLCFKQTSNKQLHDFGALKEILGVSPALHTFYWGMAEKNDDGPSPNACYFDPYEMFKSTRNLKVLGLSCTDMPVSRLVDLLICFPHLQALSLDFSITPLSALVKGAHQLEELNLLSDYDSSLNSLSVLPNLKRVRFGRVFSSGVTAAALSKLPTTVNHVTIDYDDTWSTSRVLRIPPECSDRSSLFANFLTRSTASEQDLCKRNSDSSDSSSTDNDSDDAVSTKPGKEVKRRKRELFLVSEAN